MIIVFDVGNTETTVGLFAGSTLRGHWRLTTHIARTPDEFGLLLHTLLSSVSVDRAEVRGAAIGSVVPTVTQQLVGACERWLGVDPVVVDARSPLPIRIDIDEPLSVGADRIVNTLAASRLYDSDAIVVDLGTATTYDCITADGVFIGGIIAPGVRTSAETLFRRTSKLPATELEPPARVIGKRTEEAIRSGVMFGAAEEICGLVRRIKREWPTPRTPIVIATGGLAETFKPLCEELERVEPYLTLCGLEMAYRLLRPAAED